MGYNPALIYLIYLPFFSTDPRQVNPWTSLRLFIVDCLHILSGCFLADDPTVCRQHVMFDSTGYELFQTVPPNCLRFDCWGKPENRRHASVRVWAFSAFENNTCHYTQAKLSQSFFYFFIKAFFSFLFVTQGAGTPNDDRSSCRYIWQVCVCCRKIDRLKDISR